jgi:hypothetical protein
VLEKEGDLRRHDGNQHIDDQWNCRKLCVKSYQKQQPTYDLHNAHKRSGEARISYANLDETPDTERFREKKLLKAF